MQMIYLQCDLVCQSSLLALILRAVPTLQNSPSSISDECVAVARETLNIHQQCMASIGNRKDDPSIVMKYINW